ncbi:MinD-like ATPase involved in chromosome partitioning or flagellar assembly [Haloactinospora alba]|uniref:MinD-like ATPase involved in chromosome partitioning or flagellar assembly n=1 Tax=Haloactinospora alba TaxID=405555 RepID=A0A543NEB1_9ACTN|nr:hypothetical protein [Haloactinospora alba]TQN30181.1 MinD-like ATPase involved in chromosome partitioning or flagellar assembly [Haloactinospora alba]
MGAGASPYGAAAANRHGDTLTRRAGRWAAAPFLPPHRVRTPLELGGALQRTVTTGRRVVVSRPRTGAGESTVTALLASVLAHYRNDRVLAMDITPGSESLARRLGVRPESSLEELDHGSADLASFPDVAPHLAHPRERLWALPSVRADHSDQATTTATFHRTLLPLTRFFGVTLIDRGADVFDGFNQAAQASAHAHVLVTPATRDGAVSIGRAFDWMVANGSGSLPARTVVVLVEQAPEEDPTFDAQGAGAILRESGAAVVRIGYDRHLAATAAFDPRLVADATRVAAVRAAAEALRRAG